MMINVKYVFKIPDLQTKIVANLSNVLFSSLTILGQKIFRPARKKSSNIVDYWKMNLFLLLLFNFTQKQNKIDLTIKMKKP